MKPAFVDIFREAAVEMRLGGPFIDHFLRDHGFPTSFCLFTLGYSIICSTVGPRKMIYNHGRFFYIEVLGYPLGNLPKLYWYMLMIEDELNTSS